MSAPWIQVKVEPSTQEIHELVLWYMRSAYEDDLKRFKHWVCTNANKLLKEMEEDIWP